MTVQPKSCLCCKIGEIGKNTFYCENCWNYLMPNKGVDGIAWGDIWTLVAHWHACHDAFDKDYDFVHDVVLVAYSEKHHG